MNTCAVASCKRPVARDGLCCICALTWLLSKDSAPTPGREQRLHDFVVRQDIRNTLKGEDAATEEVKAGQVWQHKNTSTQWVVGENPWTQGERRWWGLRRVGPDGVRSVPEWILTDDYILVKDAP